MMGKYIVISSYEFEGMFLKTDFLGIANTMNKAFSFINKHMNETLKPLVDDLGYETLEIGENSSKEMWIESGAACYSQVHYAYSDESHMECIGTIIYYIYAAKEDA